jgi:predicted dinucleotide-utilizing enzyme
MQDIRTTQSIEDSASQDFFFSRELSLLGLNLKSNNNRKLFNGIVFKTIPSFKVNINLLFTLVLAVQFLIIYGYFSSSVLK